MNINTKQQEDIINKAFRYFYKTSKLYSPDDEELQLVDVSLYVWAKYQISDRCLFENNSFKIYIALPYVKIDHNLFNSRYSITRFWEDIPEYVNEISDNEERDMAIQYWDDTTPTMDVDLLYYDIVSRKEIDSLIKDMISDREFKRKFYLGLGKSLIETKKLFFKNKNHAYTLL